MHAIARLRSNPQHYVPLFEQDPVAFLHEEARVDPPVTSFTSVLRKDTLVELGPSMGSRIFEKETPFQVILSTANMDPTVFGGPHHSKSHAKHFDPTRENMDHILSWNGKLKDVQAGIAPRGCPGYRLSMALSRALVQTFLPSESQPPSIVDIDSRIYYSHPPTDPNIAARKHDGVKLPSNLAHSRDHFVNLLPPPDPFVPSFFDKIGYTLWLISTVMTVGYLWGRQPSGSLGAVSFRFLHYLLAQACVALGFLLELDWFQIQSQIFAGFAYSTIVYNLTFPFHYLTLAFYMFQFLCS